ncbi:MAG: hypothetical protein KGI08_08400 [Thaumarchaeota archaeon]|nr:hypothetical protein [Nitrososphaerota archaeon]
MGFNWIFKNDDYVHVIKKPKKVKQARIPKPPKDYNGSKPVPGKHDVKFVKAKNLDKS